jgi:hypothetical protein
VGGTSACACENGHTEERALGSAHVGGADVDSRGAISYTYYASRCY